MSLLHQIALTGLPGCGAVTARLLVERFGNAEAIFNTPKADLLDAGIRKPLAEAIVQKEGFSRAEEEVAFVEKNGIKTLFYADKAFPQRLRMCYDTPVLLYYKGDVDFNAKHIISVVGTRNATAYGREICDKLIEDLQRFNVLIISGLAHGIDSLAHRACIKHHVQTAAVLGHGLDRIYPAVNRDLAVKMLENGALLTEFMSGTNPDRENFPKRNRIIAGLADATIVVEAALKGGALITAELANSYNRDVFAFPGDVYHEYSAGCNYLIKTNRAALISGIKDLEYILGWTLPEQKPEPKPVLNLNLSGDEQTIVDCIEASGLIGIDDLALKTNIPQNKLAMLILELEMQEIIIAMPGKIYRLAN
ncbi:DNA-protecting protein DprA [Pedobacter sp. BS3]|uniref:DNA-processing protein DprA n=1 Tax=Pedobacter sp. BS3 TaxID=2567937 RepID=UPI0011EF232E|nr:DNA-processing protein DprA [Pedobacter sp. BS3]TZF82682.1 DNA-protecting protein DprA [Pedobacter sp. BS3]